MNNQLSETAPRVRPIYTSTAARPEGTIGGEARPERSDLLQSSFAEILCDDFVRCSLNRAMSSCSPTSSASFPGDSCCGQSDEGSPFCILSYCWLNCTKADQNHRPTGRHTKSTAGTTAQVTAATLVAGRAPKRRCGGGRGTVRLGPQSPYRRR